MQQFASRTLVKFIGGPLAAALSDRVELLPASYGGGFTVKVPKNAIPALLALQKDSQNVKAKKDFGVDLCAVYALTGLTKEGDVNLASAYGVRGTEAGKILRGTVSNVDEENNTASITVYGPPSNVAAAKVEADGFDKKVPTGWTGTVYSGGHLGVAAPSYLETTAEQQDWDQVYKAASDAAIAPAAAA